MFRKDMNETKTTFKPIHENVGETSKNPLLYVIIDWLTNEKHLALFQIRTIVRDAHHGKSPTHWEQDLNLHRTWVQAMMNEVVQLW